MKWNDIREHYPEQWVLVEAVKAHSEGKKRIVESLTLIDTFPDSTSAWQEYKKLHHASPYREFYIVHTSRQELEITERSWFGIRAA